MCEIVNLLPTDWNVCFNLTAVEMCFNSCDMTNSEVTAVSLWYPDLFVFTSQYRMPVGLINIIFWCLIVIFSILQCTQSCLVLAVNNAFCSHGDHQGLFVSSVRHVLTVEATKTLVTSLLLSRLDYHNSLLSGMPQQIIKKLQKVQNCSARLIFKNSKRTHASPLLTKLHWLPVAQRIEYNWI